MSTKSSIIYTSDDEHWYYDMITENFILEFDLKNVDYQVSADSITIRINGDVPKSDLHKSIMEYFLKKKK